MISHDAITVEIDFTDHVMFPLVAVSGVALLAVMGVNVAWQEIFGI